MSTPSAPKDMRIGRSSVTAALVLDLLIAVYLLALAVILATGGLDLGVVRFNRAAKPILILLIDVDISAGAHENARLRVRAPARAVLEEVRAWTEIRALCSQLQLQVSLSSLSSRCR